MVRRRRTVDFLSRDPVLQCTLWYLTLLFRFLQGIQAEDTALLLPDFCSEPSSIPSIVPGSSFGRIGRGGITTSKPNFVASSYNKLNGKGTHNEK